MKNIACEDKNFTTKGKPNSICKEKVYRKTNRIIVRPNNWDRNI